MIFLHMVFVVLCLIENRTAQFLHPTCKWKSLQTHFLTFYRKRLISISNSETLFHWPFSMSSSWLWWHSAPLLPESSNGSQSSVSTAEENTLLASPFTSKNRRILRWRNQSLYASYTIQAFCREPNWSIMITLKSTSEKVDGVMQEKWRLKAEADISSCIIAHGTEGTNTVNYL